jgi:hypothetical protein
VRLDAHREYSSAWEKLFRDNAAAISHGERALELDPRYVLPRFALAYWLRGRDNDQVRKHLDVWDSQYPMMPPFDQATVRMWRAMIEGSSLEALYAGRDVLRLAPEARFMADDVAEYALHANRPREALEILLDYRYGQKEMSPKFLAPPGTSSHLHTTCWEITNLS